jgi:hypothetical protein
MLRSSVMTKRLKSSDLVKICATRLFQSTMTFNFQFHIACIAFDSKVPESVLSLIRILDTLAKDLAGSSVLRFVMSEQYTLQF